MKKRVTRNGFAGFADMRDRLMDEWEIELDRWIANPLTATIKSHIDEQRVARAKAAYYRFAGKP